MGYIRLLFAVLRSVRIWGYEDIPDIKRIPEMGVPRVCTYPCFDNDHMTWLASNALPWSDMPHSNLHLVCNWNTLIRFRRAKIKIKNWLVDLNFESKFTYTNQSISLYTNSRNPEYRWTLIIWTTKTISIWIRFPALPRINGNPPHAPKIDIAMNKHQVRPFSSFYCDLLSVKQLSRLKSITINHQIHNESSSYQFDQNPITFNLFTRVVPSFHPPAPQKHTFRLPHLPHQPHHTTQSHQKATQKICKKNRN